MRKYITQNGIKYELRGEQYYPIFEISEQTNQEIGKYGHLHHDFIKKHRRGTYTTLLTEGRLNEHLHSIDEQAHEQIDLYIAQTAERMGVTEELKAYTDKLSGTYYREAVAKRCLELVKGICKPATAVKYVVALNKRSFLWDVLWESVEKFALKKEVDRK